MSHTLSEDEYRILRQTIARRSTIRMVLAAVTVFVWAATAVATAAVITVALSTLVPLLVLAAGFEAVYALHVSVERIGRYVQVFHETEGGWEHVAMVLGARRAASPDPLFSRLFAIAVSLNFLPVALGGVAVEMIVLATLHLLFIARIRQARIAANRQRTQDLELFQSIRAALDGQHAPEAPADEADPVAS